MGVLAALCVAELLARAAGLGPWTPFHDLDRLPAISEPDAELGWRNRPGVHTWDTPDGPVRVSIDATGSRRWWSAREPGVRLVGGSFVHGFGLDDVDSLGARLGIYVAGLGLDVDNRAVPGFGTVQALLDYERDPGGDVVIYGFVELHEARNVAAPSWLHALDRSGGQHPWAAVPSARWDGALTLSPPVRYRHWPVSEHVALVDLLERASVSVADRFLRTKAETTAQVMARFHRSVRGHGDRFVVVLLHAPTRGRFYLRRLGELGVPVYDLRGAEGGWLTDGHPDAVRTEAWAEALARILCGRPCLDRGDDLVGHGSEPRGVGADRG